MSRLSERLLDIINDFEEEIVVVSLVKYYDVLTDEDNDLKPRDLIKKGLDQ